MRNSARAVCDSPGMDAEQWRRLTPEQQAWHQQQWQAQGAVAAPPSAPAPEPAQRSVAANFRRLALRIGIGIAVIVVLVYVSRCGGKQQSGASPLGDSCRGSGCTLTVESAAPAAAAPRPAPAATVAPVVPAPTGPATTLAEGTYEVGVDIKPGKYKSPGGSGCYWARLGKDQTSILDNSFGDGPSVFTVKASDGYVKLSGCTWTLAA